MAVHAPDHKKDEDEENHRRENNNYRDIRDFGEGQKAEEAEADMAKSKEEEQSNDESGCPVGPCSRSIWNS